MFIYSFIYIYILMYRTSIHHHIYCRLLAKVFGHVPSVRTLEHVQGLLTKEHVQGLRQYRQQRPLEHWIIDSNMLRHAAACRNAVIK